MITSTCWQHHYNYCTNYHETSFSADQGADPGFLLSAFLLDFSEYFMNLDERNQDWYLGVGFHLDFFG